MSLIDTATRAYSHQQEAEDMRPRDVVARNHDIAICKSGPDAEGHQAKNIAVMDGYKYPYKPRKL